MDSWNKTAWKSLFVPGGILLFLTLILLKTGWLTVTPAMLTFLYYAGLLAGFLLAWRFHSSRVFFALLVLFLAQQAIGLFFSGPLRGPAHAALEATIFLVPLNFVLLSLARERGFTPASVSSTLIFLFVQSTIVAALARAGQDYPPMAHAPSHVAPLLSSPYARMGFGIAAVLLLIRFVLLRKPAESAFFWSLTSFVLAVHSGGVGRTATAYFVTCTMILAFSIIETSYLLAYHDELTTLPSRRAFQDTLLSIAVPYSIAVLDIDHFKRFNDTYGHQIGDQVLRVVAKYLQDGIREGDLAARYGGEELMCILPGASLEICRQVADRIRARVAGARVTRRGTGQEIGQVTISTGVAQFKPGESFEALIERCDEALYQAKQSGRNCTIAAAA